MRFLLLAFIVMPIVEMAVLFEVGAQIGALNTILLVMLTAFIGVNLLKKQGLSTLMSANQKLNQGGVPLEEMGEGILLAVAGALLLTPGFVTDTIGFLLLTPGFRQVMIKQVLTKVVIAQPGANPFQTSAQTDFSARKSHGDSGSSAPTQVNPMDARHDPFRSPNSEASEIAEAEFTEIPKSKDP